MDAVQEDNSSASNIGRYCDMECVKTSSSEQYCDSEQYQTSRTRFNIRVDVENWYQNEVAVKGGSRATLAIVVAIQRDTVPEPPVAALLMTEG